MTYRELFLQGEDTLKRSEIAEASLDARLLLEYVCGTNRNDMLVHGDRSVSEEQVVRYNACIEKRAQHIPLQHITGVQNFMGLDFKVNEHVLIPRQDTEILVEDALKHLRDGMSVLDMCTGSGCILISLLHYSNDCKGVGVDISPKALEIARENANALLTEASDCIQFVESNLFENVTGQFDMIVSNPPYICSKVIETLMPEVREHEPMNALDGMEDGLYFYRRIVEDCEAHLVPGGMLMFEIGHDQGEAVSALMTDADYLEVEVLKDYAGLDRVVRGVKRRKLVDGLQD